MSIICTTYTPDAIIMAADSRVTVNVNLENKDDPTKHMVHTFPMSDNGQKVFLLEKIQLGISAISGVMGNDMQATSKFIREFEKTNIRTTDSVFDVADKLQKSITDGATFHIAGYDGTEPFFYTVSKSECKRLNVQNGAIQYGITCSGEAMVFQKFMGTEPRLAINFKSFSTGDAIDFTEFLINTTIGMQRFEMKPKTCGGAIDILVLTPDGAFWKKHKFCDSTFKPMPTLQKSAGYVTDSDGNPIN